ncbi:MAG: trigger factor [Chloroflexi bacterium]|nr:MAG: trigger factor [Chloroflexota bacterium]
MQNSPKTVPPSVKHTLRRDAGSKVTLDVEVDADRLKRAADAAFERHVQRANIPGFRPGKAPRGMYERAYGKEHLWEDAADDLMDQTYREIVEAEGIEPIDRPDAKLTQLKEGEPLRYTATVVVRPDVALGDYSAHGAKVVASPPTEEEVDKTIASMRDSHAQLRPVDREARPGDILTVDIDASVPGKTALPPFARNAHIEAGKDLGIAGLGEALVGMKVGEEKKVDLAFPNDASESDLAGMTGTFSIRPSQVAEKVLPALDDEFAKTVGVADIASLRKAVRNELAHAAFHEARDEAADKAVEHAMQTSTVEVPELLVEDELEHLVNDLKARVKQEGVTWEKFLLQARKTEDDIRKEWRPVAERRAKSLLVLRGRKASPFPATSSRHRRRCRRSRRLTRKPFAPRRCSRPWRGRSAIARRSTSSSASSRRTPNVKRSGRRAATTSISTERRPLKPRRQRSSCRKSPTRHRRDAKLFARCSRSNSLASAFSGFRM